MIQHKPQVKLWDEISTVLVLISGVPVGDLKALEKSIKSHFEKDQTVTFLYFFNGKKLPEDLIRLADTFYLTYSDFNIFGSLKNKTIKQSIVKSKHDLMLCIYFKKQKNVNKLIASKKATYKVGVEQESLPKFDIAFMSTSNEPEALTKLAIKYLKQV